MNLQASPALIVQPSFNLNSPPSPRNPFSFMDLQDVQELTNFFERKVSAYQVAVQGDVAFDHAF